MIGCTTCPMVRTAYHGPTNHRGSRVSATLVGSGRRIYHPWDYALDPLANHYAAARKALSAGWFPDRVCSVKDGGYIFACEVRT